MLQESDFSPTSTPTSARPSCNIFGAFFRPIDEDESDEIAETPANANPAQITQDNSSNVPPNNLDQRTKRLRSTERVSPHQNAASGNKKPRK